MIDNIENKERKIDKRNLGDEWENWNGRDEDNFKESKRLFLIAAACVIVFLDILLFAFVYMISPRMATWHAILPASAWIIAVIIAILTIIWLLQILLTTTTGRNFLPRHSRIQPLFDIIFSGVFRLAKIAGISRDRMGHSFVRAYNSISRATKPAGREERLLLLLPRCLTKEQLKEIIALKEIYPLHIHTVSGGELARKRIKEIMPTAVIGVACERDLVSGIRDVGKNISLIGIPNKRPDGPCQNTHIDMSELISAIEFYVGPPRRA